MTEQQTSADEQKHRSGRFAVNVASNIGLLILNFAVGIFFTPYLIEVLGVAAFGIATLASSIATYLAIFDSAISNAIGRFLTIELRQGAYEKAARTFNTALGLATTVSLVMLPVIAVISWLSPRLFDVPPGYENDARWVFMAALLGYTLILTRSVFTSSSFANNRLDLLNGTLAGGTLIRVLVTVLLLTLAATPRLIHVGTGLLAGTVASLLLAIYVSHLLTPQLRVNLRQFDRGQLGLLFSVSGWVFVNELGSMLFLSIDQVIVNRALGSVVQGYYALAVQWSLLLRTLAGALSTALAPLMVGLYAQGDNARLAETSINSVRLMGVLMALPTGLIAGFGQPLLRVWMGTEYEALSLLLAVIILPLSVNLAVKPLYPLQITYNRVRLPAIVSLVGGILNAILAIWWVRMDGTGIGVALAGALVFTLRSAVFTPLYAAHFQQLPRRAYMLPILMTALAACLVAAIARWVAVTFVIENWLSLVASVASVSVVYLVLAYAIGLQERERLAIRQLLSRSGR